MARPEPIKAKDYPLTLEGIGEILHWLKEEEQAIANGLPCPDPTPLLQGWPHDPAQTQGDTVAIRIRLEGPGSKPRLFDSSLQAFLRLALGFAGSLSQEAVREVAPGEGQYYPKVTLSTPDHLTGSNHKLARIALDTHSNRHARFRTDNFYNCRLRNLVSQPPLPHHKPGEQGREKAIQAALRVFERYWHGEEPPISRTDYEEALRLSLRLLDEREALRLRLAAYRALQGSRETPEPCQ